MLTSQMLKEYAKKAGADLVGIAPISRFSGAPVNLSPTTIFPEAKSVVVIGCRILEGSYIGIKQGTDWSTYWIYGYGQGIYGALGEAMSKTMKYVESFGYEAVKSPGKQTLEDGPPDRPPVTLNKAPSDVAIHMRIAAALAGLGEIGWSKIFLTPEFGPRQRFEVFLTDAQLDPDPMMHEHICDKCMACVRKCPGHALSKEEKASITVDGRTFEWGVIDCGKCKVTHWGLNPLSSPFVIKDLPGLNLDVDNTKFSWYEAFKLGFAIADRIEYIKLVSTGFDEIGQVGRPGSICGAKGCIQACYEHLKKAGRIKGSAVSKIS